MNKNMDSFANNINRASEVPDDRNGGANIDLPQLFGDFPVPDGERVVSDVRSSESVQGVPTYNFTAHFRRFIMGQVEVGRENGVVEYTQQDDSAAYEALLNDMLQGKAILRFEERQTLKEGTFVVSVCYLTPKKKLRSGP